MKKAIVLLLVAALATAGGFVWKERRAQADARRNDGVATYRGNVEIRRANLGFRVGGKIAEFRVDEGDSVRRGDALATLDRAPLAAEAAASEARFDAAAATLERLENGSRPQEIEEARAQTEEYRAALVLAKTEYDRNVGLVPKGAVSQSDLDAALSSRDAAAARLRRSQETLKLLEEGPRKEEIAAARAQLAEADANRTKARIALEDAELKAPNDGVLLTRVAEPGVVVQAGQTVATLSLKDVVWVYIFVEEPDLGKVAPGGKATIRTDSSTTVYSGRVGYVSPEAEFTPKTVETPNLRTNLVYRARIVVENPDDSLRQGAPVDVEIFSPNSGSDSAVDAGSNSAANDQGTKKQ